MSDENEETNETAHETTDFKQVQEAFVNEVGNLVETIKGQSASLKEAPVAPTPVTPPTPTEPELTVDYLNDLADPEKEGSPGRMIQEVGRRVIAPVVANQYKLAMKAQRKMVEHDAELGEYARKHKTEITERVKALGITDNILAEDGYEDVVRGLMNADPEISKAKLDVEVAKAVAAALAERGIVDTPKDNDIPVVNKPPVGTRPPVERPGIAPSTVPNPATKTRDQAIAAVQMSTQEINDAWNLWGMDEKEAKEARHSRIEMENTLGEHGFKQAGGWPVCTLEDIGLKPVRGR